VKGWHSSEGIIKHHMELGRDVLGAGVEYQRYQRRVLIRETDKDALPCPTVPLRDFLAILQSWIKNIHRATEHMATGKLGARAF
jgi:hypothetical protein